MRNEGQEADSGCKLMGCLFGFPFIYTIWLNFVTSSLQAIYQHWIGWKFWQNLLFVDIKRLFDQKQLTNFWPDETSWKRVQFPEFWTPYIYAKSIFQMGGTWGERRKFEGNVPPMETRLHRDVGWGGGVSCMIWPKNRQLTLAYFFIKMCIYQNSVKTVSKSIRHIFSSGQGYTLRLYKFRQRIYIAAQTIILSTSIKGNKSAPNLFRFIFLLLNNNGEIVNNYVLIQYYVKGRDTVFIWSWEHTETGEIKKCLFIHQLKASFLTSLMDWNKRTPEECAVSYRKNLEV